MAKALVHVCPPTGKVPVRIANPYDRSCIINEHTIVAVYEPVDPAEILKVHATQITESSQSSFASVEIQAHLKTLYSDSCNNLTPDQQTRFKQLLIDFQKTFSKSFHDLGQTSLVEHKIDIIPDTNPIKQRPYRLPL